MTARNPVVSNSTINSPSDLIDNSAVTAGVIMTSVVAAYVMPEHGWRGMFAFGGMITVLMSLARSLKYATKNYGM